LIGGAGQSPLPSYERSLDVVDTSNQKFNGSVGVAVSADNRIYVADNFNQRVQVFKFDSVNNIYKWIATLDTTGSRGSSTTQFDNPVGVAISAVDNRIYVVDCFNGRIQVFDDKYEWIATLDRNSDDSPSAYPTAYPNNNNVIV
jgi:DNA-binding beta-propeller fold protein YncE